MLVCRLLRRMRGDDNMEAHIRNDFILQQLLALAKVIDVSDEYRRWDTASDALLPDISSI